MKSRSGVFRAALCAAMVLLAAVGARADFVTIGNPGNTADVAHGSNPAAGAVPYTYQISKTAVSIAEWSAFYNAANSNKIGTLNANYNYWNDGTRSVGLNAPAVYISFNHAAQYCNWLTTGNATQGAYTIDGNGAVTGTMTRAEILATGQQYYLIPTEDEWYKAAYYTGSGYTLYSHGQNTVPLQSTDGTTGWNYGNALSSPWTVGSGTEEQNGTLNMMGNVWEWNEALIDSNRGLRGGSYSYDEGSLRASDRSDLYPAFEYYSISGSA